MVKIADRIKHVEENINSACLRSGRNRQDVKLIVVTKSAAFDAILEVLNHGITCFGENRVQQLKKVSSQVEEVLQNSEPDILKKINWHMIGHLQRNKVRQVLPLASMIHSVDTLRLAEEINTMRSKIGDMDSDRTGLNDAPEVNQAEATLVADSFADQSEQKMTATVSAGKAQLYTAPGKRHSILFILRQGEEVEVLSKIKEWSKVVTPIGVTAWVQTEKLKFDS